MTKPEPSEVLLRDSKTALMYEELRAAIDGGHESMTHADALAEIAAIREENEKLHAELAAIGAGGVTGQPQAMPDLPALTERGAKAWAGVDAQGLREGGAGFTAADMATAAAQGFRDGVASLAASAGEPVYQARYQKGFWQDSSRERCKYLQNPENTCAEDWETRILYTHPSPTSAEGVEHG